MNSIILVELVSADPAAALRNLGEKGITVFDVVIEPDEMTCRFHIQRRHYAGLKALADRSGDALTIMHRKGIFWTLKGFSKRPVLC